MAHFARIENGIVREVIVVSNDVAPDEATGLAFIASIGLTGDFVQTSYNAATNGFRGKYAGIGDTYDAVNDVFVSPEITNGVTPDLSDTPTTDNSEA